MFIFAWLNSWILFCRYGDEEEDDEMEIKKIKLPPIPRNITATRDGLIYVVEKVIDQRVSGIKVVLARAATPDSHNSIVVTMCEPRVVIKIFPRHVPSNNRKKYQFNVQQEIAALQLTSDIPGVVDMIECANDDNYTYIVMTHLSGGDLLSRVENTSGLAEDIVRGYLKSIVTTLKTMQEQCGLVHHDLSLDNMMLDGNGALHLIDLGLSIKIPGDTQLATSLVVPQLYGGKSSYIAPELARLKPVVNVYAADVWSLGVCLYNLLTAAPLYERPFDSTFNTMETRGGIKSILKMDEIQYGRHFSPQAKNLLCTMLDPDPCKRPSFKKILDHPFVTGVEVVKVDGNWEILREKIRKVIQQVSRIFSCIATMANDFFSVSVYPSN